MVNPKNIIIRMPNWIGDAVMATPVLADIKSHYPEAFLTVLCQGGIGQLFSHDNNVDKIITFTKPNGWIQHLSLTPFIQELRKGEYDAGLLLTNSFSSAWWFRRGKVKNRIGFKGGGRSALLNYALPYPKDIETSPLVQTYKTLLGPLDIPPSETKPYLVVSPSEKEHAKDQLSKLGTKADSLLIGFNPGAAFGSAKCWLPERFTKVASELLADPKVWIIFFGDSKGRPLTEQIVKDIPVELHGRVINLAGKTTIRELISYISCLRVMLSNDSGPMHIASAVGTPVVAIFGSTNDTKTGPQKPSIVIHKHVECSPCYKRECPIDFRCMTRIEADEVTQAIKRLLHDTA